MVAVVRAVWSVVVAAVAAAAAAEGGGKDAAGWSSACMACEL